MNYKSKAAITLLSLLTLTACGNDENKPNIDTGTDPDQDNSNLLVNGDFEAWSAELPTDWTTIDSGINITKESLIYKTGLRSAEVYVNTGDQGNTDFRQSVDVEAGKEYTFSTWIYHTEGYVKARLYVGGNYSNNYSANNLVNQWQEVTYTYTAKDNLSIEIGVRFYDQSGFDGSEVVYLDNFSFISDTVLPPVDPDPGPNPDPDPDPDPEPGPDPEIPENYYDSAKNKTGFELKTALHNIIKDHTAKSYGDLWTFMNQNSLDKYYEKDGTILDMYSEIPSTSDTYNYTAVINQCGNYSGEGSCYNREHSFPQSWFAKKSPMVSDVHHIFATDGYVNGKRNNYPYGDVQTATFTSDNGSKLGDATAELGYNGIVFEPIDEFKGDFARAQFYMATRYQDIIGSWENNSEHSSAVLDGSSNNVFDPWVIALLKKWHTNDPVSQKDIDRNNAAASYQGNRNPFVDHPEFVNEIWGN